MASTDRKLDHAPTFDLFARLTGYRVLRVGSAHAEVEVDRFDVDRVVAMMTVAEEMGIDRVTFSRGGYTLELTVDNWQTMLEFLLQVAGDES